MHGHTLRRKLQSQDEEQKARAREYHEVLQAARLLGHDAGLEMYCDAHEDDTPPRVPDPCLWQDWHPRLEQQDHIHRMRFNAQMAFATARVRGFEEAMQIDWWDKVEASLREAS